jgi:hypothetical protein
MAPDNALELALAAALADPTKQGGLETALLAAELHVSSTGGPPSSGVELGRDAPLRLDGIVLDADRQATAAFTRPEYAVPVFGAPTSMAMRGRHLLEAFRNGWIALNPGRPQGLVLSPDDIAAILRAAGQAQPFADTADVDLTVPDPEPSLLVARLRTALADEAIQAVWLARTRHRATGAEAWRLEVRARMEISDVRARVEAAVDGLNFQGEPLDLLIAPPFGADGVGLKLI